MRVFCPYTAVQNATMTALTRYFFDELLFVDVSEKWAFPNYFRQRWAERKTFINIEHDVVPWLGAVEELWDCPHDWCYFDYHSAPGKCECDPPPIGLVKFTEQFIKSVPDVWEDFVNHYYEIKDQWDPERTTFPWNHLDMHLNEYAKVQRGIEPHQHWPSVVNAKPLYGSVSETLGARVIKGSDAVIDPEILDYTLSRFDFAPIVCDILDVDDLTNLAGEDYGVYDLLTNENGQSTLAHKAFYAAFETKMGALYREFVKDTANRLGATNVYYQAVPTLRIHFPNNLAVERPHIDLDYNHQNGETSFWVPLTAAYHSNTIWVEGARGAQNYRPWELQPGQLLMFDGVNWSHCNMRNRTGVSRVSFDFRLLRKDQYRDTGLLSVNGRKMTVGDYWKEL